MSPQLPKSSKNGLYAQGTVAKLVDDLLSQRSQHRIHALFLIDHDTLNSINLRFGHEQGGAVIAHTSQVLPTVFRETDLIARTDGDEFIVFTSNNVELYDDDDAMLRIYNILKQVCGVDFMHYKRSTVVRRIERRMVVTHASTFMDFASLLEIDDREAKALGREILIGITHFSAMKAHSKS